MIEDQSNGDADRRSLTAEKWIKIIEPCLCMQHLHMHVIFLLHAFLPLQLSTGDAIRSQFHVVSFASFFYFTFFYLSLSQLFMQI